MRGLIYVVPVFCVILLNASVASCQETYTGDTAGLERLAKDLNGNRDLLMKLRPTDADIAAMTSSQASAKQLKAYLDKLYSSIPASGIGGKAGQTKVRIRSGKMSEIKAGTDRHMPGGYQRTAKHYADELVVYSVAYTEPDKELGMRFDVFVYLKDHWVCAPKMWRAFPGEEDTAVSEPPAEKAVFNDGLKLLGRRIGSWKETITAKQSPGNPNAGQATRDLIARPILKGRFLEMVSGDEKFQSKQIVSYEPAKNLFRIIAFDSNGDMSSWEGRQTAANVVEFKGEFTDGRTGVSKWTFEGKDRLIWAGKIFTKEDKLFADVSGEVVRQP